MTPFDASVNPFIDVDGTRRPALNSEGQPIHWSLEGILNFWRWFGDSRAVDARGRPLVVHHGGYKAAEIQEFDNSFGGDHTGNNERGAFYFSSEREVAEDYSRAAFAWRCEYGSDFVEKGILPPDASEADIARLAEKHISVFSAYLKILNPVEEDHCCEVIKMEEHELLAEFAMNKKDDNSKFYDLYRLIISYEPADIEEMRTEIEQHARLEHGLDESDPLEDWQFEGSIEPVMHDSGYTPNERRIDGLILKNVVDNISPKSHIPADNFVVFDPCSIKSVNNSGMFLPWRANVLDPNPDFDPPKIPSSRPRMK